MVHVVRLGEAEGGGMLEDRPTAVRRTSTGRFLVVGGGGNDASPAVFDSMGTFVERIGRRGQGPGEFLRATEMLLVSDSVFLFDTGNGRLTVLSPRFGYIRALPLPPSTYSAAVDGETLFLNARVVDRAGAGYALHRFARTGSYLGPLGEARLAKRNQPPDVWWLATSRFGGVWSVPANGDYVLKRWSTDGKSLATITRRPDWYPAYAKVWVPTPTRPPAPAISGVWEDAAGLLWVVGLAPDPKWLGGLGPPIRAEGQSIYPWLDHHKLFDGVIEVMDPSTGQLLATRRFDVPLDLVVGGGLFTSYREGTEVGLQVDVWRLILKR